MAKKDITRGKLTYKDLQEINNENQSGIPISELNKIRENAIKRASMYRQSAAQTQDEYIQSPLSVNTEGKDYFGKSKYDEDYTYSVDPTAINEQRYNNQGVLDTLGNGVVKFAGKVGSTVVNTFAGIPTGIVTAIDEGRLSGLWDNAVTDATAKFDDYMNENFTNYQSNAQKNASWFSLENLGSMHFWMDDVFTNAGFTVGAIISGNIVGGAMGTAMSLVKAAQLAQKSQKAASFISSLVSATGEGSIEAKQAQKEYVENGMHSIKQYYGEKELALQEKYRNAIGKNLISTSEGTLIDPAYQAYQKELNDLKNERNIAEAQLNEEGRKVGNRVLLGNQVLLTFGNMVQFGKSFSKSFENASRYEILNNKATGKGLIKSIGRDINKAATEMGEKMAANGGKATAEMAAETGIKNEVKRKALGRVGAFLKNPATEGFEEMNQQFITSSAEAYYENRHKTADTYYKDRMGLSEEKTVDDYINEFGKSLADGFGKSYGDFEQWEQFAIGAMMGAGGVYSPTKVFNQDKTKSRFNPLRYGSWEGSAIQDVLEYNKKINRAEGNVKALNELLSSEKFWNKWYNDKKDLASLLAIQQRQDEAITNNDKKSYKDEEDNYFAEIVRKFYRAGKIDDLRAIYNSKRDLTDEEIETIVKESAKTETNEGTIKQERARVHNEIQEISKKLQNLKEAQMEQLSELGTTSINNEDILDLEDQLSNKVKELEAINKIPIKTSYVSNYLDENGARRKDKSNDAIRRELNDVSDKVNKKIDDYLDAAVRVQNDTKGLFSDEREDVLTWLAVRSKNSFERGDKLFDDNKVLPYDFNIKAIQSGNKSLKTLKEIKEALLLQDNDITENEKDGTFTIHTGNMNKNRRKAIFNIATSSKENAKLLTEQVKLKAAQEGLDADSEINTINDIVKLMAQGDEYQQKLIEYMLTPEKIEEDKSRVATEEKKKAAKKDLDEHLKGLSPKDIATGLRNGDIIEEEIDPSLLDDENKTNYKLGKELADSYGRIEDAINESALSAEEKKIALAVLGNKYDGSANLEDFLDITKAQIEAVNRDDLLDITGYGSVAELRNAMKAVNEYSDDEDAVEGLNMKAIKAVKDAVDDENKTLAKLRAEVKPQTKEEKDKEDKKNSETSGRDGGTKSGNGVKTTSVELGEMPLGQNSTPTKYRAIKSFLPGTDDFEIIFEKQNEDGSWEEMYLELPVGIFNEFQAESKEGKPVTLDTLQTANERIRVKSLKTTRSKGVAYLVATVNGTTRRKKSIKKIIVTKDNKTMEVPLELHIQNDNTVDSILGLAQGTFGAVAAKGTSLKVVNRKGDAEQEQNTLNQALENAKTRYEKARDTAKGTTSIIPRTSRFYVRPFDSSPAIFKPYYELEREFAKNNPKEKDYWNIRAVQHEIIYNWLNDPKRKVFDNQDKVTKGDKVRFAFSKELNDLLRKSGGEPVLLMVDSKGNVVADLAAGHDGNEFYKNENLVSLYKYAEKHTEGDGDLQYVKVGDEFLTSIVANKYIGTPHYGNTNTRATETLVTEDSEHNKIPDFELMVTLGPISRAKGESVKVTKNAKGKVEAPLSAKVGQPYVLIHTSNEENPWFPVPILMNTYDTEDLKNTDFYKVFLNNLAKIKNAVKNNTLKEFSDSIRNFLSLSEKEIYVFDNKGTIDIRCQGKVIWSKSAEEVSNAKGFDIAREIAEAFNNSPVPISLNVSANLFDQEFTITNSDSSTRKVDYKSLIGDLIYTNAVSNRTVNDFFDINPIEFKDGKPVEGEAKPLTKPQPGDQPEIKGKLGDNTGVKSTIKGGYYYKENGNIIVCEKDKTPIIIDDSTPEDIALNASWTWVLANNPIAKDGSYTVPYFGGRTLLVSKNGTKLEWGREPISKNKATNDFVAQFKKDQELVDKKATDAEHYEINGEDKVRLHAEIDSEYGDAIDYDKIKKGIKTSIQQRQESVKKALENHTPEELLQNIDANFSFLSQQKRDELAQRFFNNDDEHPIKPKDFYDAVAMLIQDTATGFRGLRAVTTGQAVDYIVRNFFTKEWYKRETLPRLPLEYSDIISNEVYKSIAESLKSLYKEYGNKYTFVADSLVVDGKFGDTEVAGEIDLLAIDKETGDVEIWDIKTSSRTFRNDDGTISTNFTEVGDRDGVKLFTRSSEESYTIQLNAYKDMIKQKYGIKVKALKILPFFVQYNGTTSTVKSIQRQKEIPLSLRDNVIKGKKKKEEPDKTDLGEKKLSDGPVDVIVSPSSSSVDISRENIQSLLAKNYSSSPRYVKLINDALDLIDKRDNKYKEALVNYLNVIGVDSNLSIKRKGEDIISYFDTLFNMHAYSEDGGNIEMDIAVKAIQEGKKIGTGLDLFKNAITSKQYAGVKALMEVIKKTNSSFKDFLSQIEVYEVELPESTKAVAFQGGNKIFIDTNKLKSYSNESKQRIIMHEVIHAFTSRAYDTNAEFRREIDSLYSRAIKAIVGNSKDLSPEQLDKLSSYGFTDPYEFMSEAFTNPKFMKILNEIKDTLNKEKSIWQKFIDTILRVMRLDIKEYNTILTSSLDSILNNAEIINYSDYKTKKQNFEGINIQKVLNKINLETGSNHNINRIYQQSAMHYFNNTYSKEEQDILDKAPRDKDGNLLAPNGKVSNLTERQYAQVRTKAFKRWFGDWENVNKFNINAIDTSKVDIEEVDKPWKKNNTKSNKTIRIYLKNQHDKGYFELVKDEEFGIYSVHFKTVNEKGLGTTGANPSTKEERAILYEQLINAIPNGALVSTWGEVSKGGEIALNKVGHNMTKVGERTVTSKSNGQPISIPIYQKGEGVSKVVDENGEPLVVYHGTDDQFNTFDISFFGRTDSGDWGKGFYFTPIADVAKNMYGDIVMPVFLNIKTPVPENKLKNSRIYFGRPNKEIITKRDKLLKDIELYNMRLNNSKERINPTSEYYVKGIGNEIEKLNVTRYENKIKELNDELSSLSKEEASLDINSEYNINVEEFKNYDGVIPKYPSNKNLKNLHEIIVKNSNQIKSAIDNVGTFSFENDDIRYYRDFTLEDKIDYIIKKSPKNSDGELLAPNGKPSKLHPKIYGLVRTKEFLRAANLTYYADMNLFKSLDKYNKYFENENGEPTFENTYIEDMVLYSENQDLIDTYQKIQDNILREQDDYYEDIREMLDREGLEYISVQEYLDNTSMDQKDTDNSCRI